MSDALKPCPFCGSNEVHVVEAGPGNWVSCLDCDSDGPVVGTIEKAVAAWNTRAALEQGEAVASSDAAAAMERAKKLPIWDGGVPHELHKELDIIFRHLSAPPSTAEAQARALEEFAEKIRQDAKKATRVFEKPTEGVKHQIIAADKAEAEAKRIREEG